MEPSAEGCQFGLPRQRQSRAGPPGEDDGQSAGCLPMRNAAVWHPCGMRTNPPQRTRGRSPRWPPERPTGYLLPTLPGWAAAWVARTASNITPPKGEPNKLWVMLSPKQERQGTRTRGGSSRIAHRGQKKVETPVCPCESSAWTEGLDERFGCVPSKRFAQPAAVEETELEP